MPAHAHPAAQAHVHKAKTGHMPLLHCPQCHEAIWMIPAECFEGAIIRCKHCRNDAWLAREFSSRTGQLEWSLMDPEVEADDEDYGD